MKAILAEVELLDDNTHCMNGVLLAGWMDVTTAKNSNLDTHTITRDVAGHVRRFSRLNSTEVLDLFKEAAVAWMDDNAPRLGASLAYYTLLSLAPLLVVAVAVAAMVFGKTAVEGQLFWQTRGLLGQQGASAVQELIRNADHPGSGVLSTVLGLLTLLFGASSVVIELTDALNTIWHVPAPTGGGRFSGILNMFKQRAHAFAIILGTGFLLLVSLLLNAVISATGAFFNSLLPVPEGMLRFAEFIFAFLITTVLFAAIYKVMPAVRLDWSDVFIGACVTSLLFTAGKQLIGLYLGKESFASTYGAAGSLVAVLVWVYYSAQLFFLGAEFTKVYTQRFGSHRDASVAKG